MNLRICMKTCRGRPARAYRGHLGRENIFFRGRDALVTRGQDARDTFYSQITSLAANAGPSVQQSLYDQPFSDSSRILTTQDWHVPMPQAM
jgi:hypothetical protein